MAAKYVTICVHDSDSDVENTQTKLEQDPPDGKYPSPRTTSAAAQQAATNPTMRSVGALLAAHGLTPGDITIEALTADMCKDGKGKGGGTGKDDGTI